MNDDPELIIGRLIQSQVNSFRFACSPVNASKPKFGQLVKAETEPGIQSYGLISNIVWASDDLTSQLAQAAEIAPTILSESRKIGQSIDVVIVGYWQDGIHHALPPRPPAALTQILLCREQEIVEFTSVSFAFFRLIIRPEIPQFCDLAAAFIQQANLCHIRCGNDLWIKLCLDFLIDLVADYDNLLQLMDAIAQTVPDFQFEEGETTWDQNE